MSDYIVIDDHSSGCDERQLKGATLSGGTLNAIGRSAAEVTLEFRLNGTAYREINGVSAALSLRTDWLRPTQKAPGRWSGRAELVEGDAPTGKLDSWMGLAHSRSWGLRQSGSGRKRTRFKVSLSPDDGRTARTVIYDLEAGVA